jgi:cell division protein ZapD
MIRRGKIVTQQPFLSFEHPLNERMRTFLRTEYLFNLAKYRYNHLDNEWDSRDCVTSIIELYNLIERTEFRSELLKELERNINNLERLSSTPSIDRRTLDKVMKDIEACIEDVRTHTSRGLFPKGSDLLNTIRQRLSISGGTCSFDLPGFHYWLNLPPKSRQHFLNQWIEVLEPLEKALMLVLNLTRQSSIATKEIAEGGVFQKSLNAQSTPQLLRLVVRNEYNVYPEISANKHRVNIRFIQANFENEKNPVATQDIPFDFACCMM